MTSSATTAMEDSRLRQKPAAARISPLVSTDKKLVFSVEITASRLLTILENGDGAGLKLEPSGASLKDMVADYEKKLLKEALTRYGTTYKAAQALNTSQPTVARKAKLYGLEW